jgi:hypothetical protein
MISSEISRRAALAAFGAFVLAPAAVVPGALAQPSRFAAIHVDVGPLRANAGEPTASWVARALPSALAQAFAQDGRGGAPVSVRIDYVILGPNTGAGGPAGSSPDQMVGSVSQGGVERPLRATTYYYPSPVDQTMVEQSNYDRVAKLSQAFASWVAQGY